MTTQQQITPQNAEFPFAGWTAPPPPTPLRDLAREAGVEFNGVKPWDIQVRDSSLYDRIVTAGALGFGESYVDGQWEARDLDETFNRLLRINVEDRLGVVASLRLSLGAWRNKILNRQSQDRAFEVGERHYDIGNSVYRAMLDSAMNYSCGYWKDAENLEEAQLAKLEMICRKLELQPGQTLLDVGCGWGGLAEYAARTRGVEVVGITISREQETLARERCAGLPVEIRFQDYRDLEGEFDKIASVGMFEHVGRNNHHDYFATLARSLKADGLVLVQSIGNRDDSASSNPWIDKYIFPNGEIPSAAQTAEAFAPFFVLEDWHNFGQDYDRTLMAWWENFDRHWPELEAEGYDQRFYRMWRYYLHSCAGFFRARHGQLWQLVLSKPERSGVYRSRR